MSHKTLLIGGARSGKSSRAESLSATWPSDQRVYMATYQLSLANDAEMNQRIRLHQENRGPDWVTLEVGANLPEVLLQHSTPHSHVLIDCLTMWVAGIMNDDVDIMTSRCQELVESIKTFEGTLVMVGNELGSGVVPEGKATRQFRDVNGWLNQWVAAVADTVEYYVAGLPIVLKGQSS